MTLISSSVEYCLFGLEGKSGEEKDLFFDAGATVVAVDARPRRVARVALKPTLYFLRYLA